MLSQFSKDLLSIPEIQQLKQVPEPLHAHPEGNTFEHVKLCLEYAEATPYILVFNERKIQWAIALHDIGKLNTPKHNWPHHYGHENLGDFLIRKIASEYKLLDEYRDFCLKVCRLHMKTHVVLKMRDKKIKDFITAIGYEDLIPFFVCCECDHFGRDLPASKYKAEGQEWERIVEKVMDRVRVPIPVPLDRI